MGIRKTELMTEDNLKIVIKNLKSDKPWTKKKACAYLGMSYNVTKLDKILTDFTKEQEYKIQQYKKKSYKKVTESEVKTIISSYLQGDSMAEIAANLYRSSDKVKKVLLDKGVTLRPLKVDYYNPELIPEVAVREEFKVGEVVYSPRHGTTVTIRSKAPNTKQNSKHGNVYSVWVPKDSGGYFAHVAAYDLASLEHIKEYA